jgi:GNAT superfamily N-acetyltransferase
MEKQTIQNRMITLMEQGLSADEIGKALEEEAIKKKLIEEEGDVEIFPDEIEIIAQALAFRTADVSDIGNIATILNAAYKPEVRGDEAFRSSEDGIAVTEVDIRGLFHDEDYTWTVAEAPNGRGIEEDGVMLGVCCFSTTGTSKKDGEIEGRLGSIRYLGVVPKYHGVCIGLRLLQRVQNIMKNNLCVRSMVCIPSTRESMMTWIERKGYHCVNALNYPKQLGHTLKPLKVKEEIETGEDEEKRDLETAKLLVFVKSFLAPGATANPQPATDARNVADVPPKAPLELPPNPKGVCLPPLWRLAMANKNEENNSKGHAKRESKPESEQNDDADIPDVD